MRLATVTTTCLLMLLTAAAPALAGWKLDNDASEIAFISIKAADIGEVHRFTELSGSVDDAGSATVTIELASVDTLIPIRDERMREVLFRTGVFPTATLTTSIDTALLDGLADGSNRQTSARINVNLHGQDAELPVEMTVARLSESTVMVTSLKPVIVAADTFSLGAGIEQLREIAGLPSISKAVPVSFVLTFVQE